MANQKEILRLEYLIYLQFRLWLKPRGAFFNYEMFLVC